MVEVVFEERFKQIFVRIKDKQTRNKIIKLMEKMKANPRVGKPMRYGRKGTREIYLKPFRLSYVYEFNEDKILLLDLYHKKRQ